MNEILLIIKKSLTKLCENLMTKYSVQLKQKDLLTLFSQLYFMVFGKQVMSLFIAKKFSFAKISFYTA